MNGTMNRTMKDMMSPMMNQTVTADAPACEIAEPALVAEDCKVSSFSLMAFAGGLLMTVGIILYALLSA